MRSLSLGPRPSAQAGRAFGRTTRRAPAAPLAPPPGAQAAPRATNMFNVVIDGYVRDGVLSREEAERCSRDQIEFLIRKRTGADLPTDAAAPSAGPSATNGAEQARIQAYVQDGLLTPDEAASCSAQQLEFLIRKRTGGSTGVTSQVVPAPPRRAASPGPSSPRRSSSPPPLGGNGWAAGGSPPPGAFVAGEEGLDTEQLELLREYLKAQEEQEALLQQQVENLKKEVEQLENEQQPDANGVIPFHAPPLTDAPARAAAWKAPAAEQQAVASESGSGPNMLGLAAAGLVVAGLSAAVYFAPDDALQKLPPPPKAPTSLQKPATPSGPIPFGGGTQTQAKPATPAPPAPAAVAPPAAVVAPPKPAEEKKAEAPAPAAKVEAPEAPKPQAAAPAAPAAPAAQQAAPAKPAEAPKPSPAAVAAAKEDDSKTNSRLAAEKLAAELARDLAVKQGAADKAKAAAAAAPSGSPGGLALGLALAAAGALALPQTRAAARELLDRFRGEQALVKAAQARYEGLKRLADTQAADFGKLQEKLAVAQSEYVRSLANLRSTANELEGLFGRVQNSEKAATALVSDLERFEGKNTQAKQLRAEASRVANAVASQRAAVDRALKQALKDL